MIQVRKRREAKGGAEEVRETRDFLAGRAAARANRGGGSGDDTFAAAASNGNNGNARYETGSFDYTQLAAEQSLLK